MGASASVSLAAPQPIAALLVHLRLANALDKFCPGSQEIIFENELEDLFQSFAELTKWQCPFGAHWFIYVLGIARLTHRQTNACCLTAALPPCASCVRIRYIHVWGWGKSPGSRNVSETQKVLYDCYEMKSSKWWKAGDPFQQLEA